MGSLKETPPSQGNELTYPTKREVRKIITAAVDGSEEINPKQPPFGM